MRDTFSLLGTISGTTTASVTVFGISFPFCSNIHLFTHIQYIYLGCFIRFIGVFGDDRKRNEKLKLSTAVFPNLTPQTKAAKVEHCGVSEPYASNES